jgi:hypothetical protein
MVNSSWKGALGAALSVGLIASPMIALPAGAVETPPATASVAGNGVVINEAFVSGGSAGTPFTNKYVELYNPTDAPVSLDGWSLQYRGPVSTATPGATALRGTIPAKGYFLIQGGTNGTAGSALPTPDLTAGINPGAPGGVLVLANQTTSVGALRTRLRHRHRVRGHGRHDAGRRQHEVREPHRFRRHGQQRRGLHPAGPDAHEQRRDTGRTDSHADSYSHPDADHTADPRARHPHP